MSVILQLAKTDAVVRGCFIEPDGCHVRIIPKVLVDTPQWFEQWRMLFILL